MIRSLKQHRAHSVKARTCQAFTKVDFIQSDSIAKSFAEHIKSHFDELADLLLEYESFEVVEDEIARTLDVLTHLRENKKYFSLRVGQVTSFLPRNQPLYALTCFVIVPSLIASEVHFRIPHSMRHFFPKFLKVLKLKSFFPNIFVSNKERLKYLEERSALRINPKTEESSPLTNVVIFTGTPQHAERLRLVFDQRTLFITNGAGHNPIIVTETADIAKTVEAATKLQLYNQGQDCAAPNAILVHQKSLQTFLYLLCEELKRTRVGHYRDRSCRVGPISDPEDLVRIQALLVENHKWIDSSASGIIHSADSILEPTIIRKPLKEGGNFTEVFAPIFFVQQYDDDSQLAQYFESPQYARNAMYISLFGKSHYIDSLIHKKIDGKILHDRQSILRNTHPHAPGIERGTQPYGGYGYASSSLSIDRKIICKPTLPQRDIYEYVVKPLLRKGAIDKAKAEMKWVKRNAEKDIQKLLGLKVIVTMETTKSLPLGKGYVDSSQWQGNGHRYVKLEADHVYSLLDHPNAEYIATMEPKHVRHICELHTFLSKKRKLNPDDLQKVLYAIPKDSKMTDKDNRVAQFEFFQHVYGLLFGKNSGPRLTQFLLDADRQQVLSLLNI